MVAFRPRHVNMVYGFVLTMVGEHRAAVTAHVNQAVTSCVYSWSKRPSFACNSFQLLAFFGFFFRSTMASPSRVGSTTPQTRSCCTSFPSSSSSSARARAPEVRERDACLGVCFQHQAATAKPLVYTCLPPVSPSSSARQKCYQYLVYKRVRPFSFDVVIHTQECTRKAPKAICLGSCS